MTRDLIAVPGAGRPDDLRAADRTAAARRRAPGQGAPDAPPGPAAAARPISTWPSLLRKELRDRRERLLAVPLAPYLIFALTWVAAALVPSFASGLMFNWAADVVALVALLGRARVCWRWPAWMSAPASAASARRAR